MKIVKKKILPKYFMEVKNGNKLFEIRKDEDDIQVGDKLVLNEYDADDKFMPHYTGESIFADVTYVLRNVPKYGLKDGYCIIGIKPYWVGKLDPDHKIQGEPTEA